jgi:hypothetical protein
VRPIAARTPSMSKNRGEIVTPRTCSATTVGPPPATEKNQFRHPTT